MYEIVIYFTAKQLILYREMCNLQNIQKTNNLKELHSSQGKFVWNISYDINMICNDDINILK